MNCPQTQNLLHPYLDGELDLVRHLEIEHHLDDCAACRETCEAQRALRTALGAASLCYRAPAGFRERLRASLDQASRPAWFRRAVWRRVAVAAGIAFLAGSLGYLGLSLPRTPLPVEGRLAQEVVASHIRSLQAEHLTDVASSDQHTVKPWYRGKLDFAPTVPDLAAKGFSLVGGRLDYLDERPVAALVYRRRQHIVNLFLWPAKQGAAAGTQTSRHQGYQLAHWVQSGMNYYAVSDLNMEELQEFTHLVQDDF